MSLDQWQNNMSRSAQGRITIGNIHYDLENSRVPAALTKAVLRTLEREWDTASQERMPEEILTEVLDGLADTDFCRGPEIPGVYRWSRVMDARDLVHRNLDYTRFPIPLRGHVAESDLIDLERQGIGSGFARGMMRGRRPLAWVTTTRAVESTQEADSTAPADDVRSALGLLHYGEDQLLVEIRYPDELDVTLSRPTFLEGCPSLVFRSCDASDGWGRAVDLRNLNEGLPEGVHPALAFTDAYSVHVIGRLTPPAYSFDWEEMERTVEIRTDFDLAPYG